MNLKEGIKQSHLKLCACGCGQLCKNRFVQWHNILTFNHRMESNPAWNGGVKKDLKGYILVKKLKHHLANCQGYLPEHRLVYEEYHKCCLLKWAHIHHINGIKDDNRIENLEGMSHRQHSSLTHSKNMDGRVCAFCGSDKTIIRSNGRPHWSIHLGRFMCNNCYHKKYRINRKHK